MKLLDQPWYRRCFNTALMFLATVCSFLVGAPVSFGMANEVTTTVLSYDQATEYIAEKTLRTALVRLATYQFAEKHTLPGGEGRTYQMTRYEHLNLPQNPLAQGTVPGNTPMTINKVSAIAEQWGAVVTMYDVPLLTTKHKVLQKAIELLGVQAAKVFERECQRALQAATNVSFAGTSNTDRTGLATGDYIVSLDIQKAVAKLRDNGAEPWSQNLGNTSTAYLKRMLESGGGTEPAKASLGNAYTGFIGVIDAFVEQDIVKDTTFIAAAEYSNIRALFAGEVGRWLGVVFVVSNLMPKITLLASPTTASANMSVMTGGLTDTTTYNLTVTRMRKLYGLEEAVSATISQATDGSGDSIAVTLPTDALYMYRVYIGANAGTMYLAETAASDTTVAANDLTGPAFEGGQTIYITALPTTGDTAPVDPATGVTVHQTYIFGKEAFGVVDLEKMQAYLTPNTPTVGANALCQIRQAGWKAFFKCCIQNDDFLYVIESSSAFS